MPSSGGSYDFVERLWAVRRLGDLIDQIDLHGQNRELVDELVALSTKYGILTPYTSFLADERVTLHVASNALMAEGQLRQLGEVSGRAGVSQREVKQRMMKANSNAGFESLAYQDSLAAEAAAAPPAAAAQSQAGQNQSVSRGAAKKGIESSRSLLPGMISAAPRRRAGGGAGGGRANFFAGERAADGEDGKDATAVKVRQIGSKTFYWKKGRWTDSTVTEEESEKATVLTQLSDEYFRLASTQKSENNQYLTLAEPAVVKLDGKVYRIEPEKKDKTEQAR